MAGAVGFNLITFYLMRQKKVKPILRDHNSCQSLDQSMKYGLDPANTLITWKLLLGSVIFGVGWGMGGK
jgi:uncharacterized membrane protein YedE/YeeE